MTESTTVPAGMFQSAPPVKGATFKIGAGRLRLGVSIRAPREGGDRTQHAHPRALLVSIRAPREGGDTMVDEDTPVDTGFNPRPP